MKSIEEIISDLPENDRKQILKRMEELELYSKSRRPQPGHGFWIISDYSYGKRRQVCHCSVCGSANPKPIGEFCRWCGAHMDQEELDLSDANKIVVSVPSNADVKVIHAEAIIKE